MTYDVNYIYDYKKFAKNIVVFKIALIIAAIGFNISQGNSKGPALNEPLFF